MFRTTRAQSLVVAAAVVCLGAGEPPASEAPVPPAAPPQASLAEQVSKHIQAGKPAKGIALCEQQKMSPSHPDARGRKACAKAYVRLGDRLHLIGASDRARTYWTYASKLDVELLDDAAFLQRLAPPKAAPPPAASPAPQPVAPSAAPAVRPNPMAAGPVEIKKAKAKPKAPPGPRADRNFYLGLGAGYDGIGSVFLGWLHEERVALELSGGAIFPVIDSRVRVYGLRTELTPFLGLGMTTPLADKDLFGFDAESYESLYQLGETLHLDAGLSWAATHKLDISGAVIFVTSLDTNNPNQLVLFPQVSLHASYGL